MPIHQKCGGDAICSGYEGKKEDIHVITKFGQRRRERFNRKRLILVYIIVKRFYSTDYNIIIQLMLNTHLFLDM